MKLVNKIADILMPIEEVEEPAENGSLDSNENEDTSFSEERAVREEAAPPKTSFNSSRSRFYARTGSKSKSSDMRILVFKLDSFDEVKSVADALNQKRAALVNYEKVDTEIQKRICDFVNGVCYVLNGEVKRISSTMVLYVPENVAIGNGIIRGADGIFRNDMAS